MQIASESARQKAPTPKGNHSRGCARNHFQRSSLKPRGKLGGGKPVREGRFQASSMQHLFDYGPLHEAMKMATEAFPDLGQPDVAECPICGTKFSRTLLRFDFKGHLFGYFPADVCEK